MSPAKPPRLLSEAEAAEYLGISERTLRRLRDQGRAPVHTRVGRQVRYSLATINAYLNARAKGRPNA